MSAVFVCPADHKHATVGTCYAIHKCRCDDCRQGMTNRAKARRRAKLYGRWENPYVPVEPVREHFTMLQGYGLGWKRIAELAGIGNTAASQIIYGKKGANSDPRKGEPMKRISRVTAAKVLAVAPTMDMLRDGAVIPARNTHRRIQALVARGWSMSKIGARLGILPSNFTTMMKADGVRVCTARSMVLIYDELWNVDPPQQEWRDKIACSRSKSYAAKRRWLAPLAWDDIDTDVEPPDTDRQLFGNPEHIDEMAVELAVQGENMRLSALERRAAIERLWAKRWSDQLIAERLGLNVRTVLRIRQELGLTAFEQSDLLTRGAA